MLLSMSRSCCTVRLRVEVLPHHPLVLIICMVMHSLGKEEIRWPECWPESAPNVKKKETGEGGRRPQKKILLQRYASVCMYVYTGVRVCMCVCCVIQCACTILWGCFFLSTPQQCGFISVVFLSLCCCIWAGGAYTETFKIYTTFRLQILKYKVEGIQRAREQSQIERRVQEK